MKYISIADKIAEVALSTTRRCLFIDRIYDVKDTIIIPPSEGLEIHGLNFRTTGFRWYGPPDRPLFLMRDIRDSLFHNLLIIAETPLKTIFEIGTKDATTPGRIVTTNNQRKRIWVYGNDITDTYVQFGGVGYDGFGYPDVNNEANVDEDCHINNIQYGIKYNGHQCKSNVINRCRFFGGANGQSAIYSGGAFLLTAGGGSHFNEFFHMFDTTDMIGILNADVESCNRFLWSHSPTGNGKTGAPQPTIVTASRFMCDRLHSDRAAFLIQNGGDVTIEACQLGLGAQPIPRILIDTFRGVLDVKNVDFGSYGSSPDNSFTLNATPYFDIGFNTYRDGNGDSRKVRGIPGVTDIAPYQTSR